MKVELPSCLIPYLVIKLYPATLNLAHSPALGICLMGYTYTNMANSPLAAHLYNSHFFWRTTQTLTLH